MKLRWEVETAYSASQEEEYTLFETQPEMWDGITQKCGRG